MNDKTFEELTNEGKGLWLDLDETLSKYELIGKERDLAREYLIQLQEWRQISENNNALRHNYETEYDSSRAYAMVGCALGGGIVGIIANDGLAIMIGALAGSVLGDQTERMNNILSRLRNIPLPNPDGERKALIQIQKEFRSRLTK